MIEAGKYYGEGEYISFASEQQLPVVCNIDISSDTESYTIEGSWSHHTGQPKQSFSIFIRVKNKYLALVNLKYDDIELIGYLTIGSLPYVLSVRSREFNANISAVLSNIKNGYSLDGLITAGESMHQWRIRIYESGMTSARENVVRLDKNE